MIRKIIPLCLVLFAGAANLAHADPRQELTAGRPGRVVTIVDGDTVILSDGREIRLVGLQAPKIPLGRVGFKAWPLGPEAKDALSRLSLDKTVTPYFGGRRMDRHGRVLAHLFTADGTWLQGEMLAQGFARVYTFADNRAVIPQLLALEREGRENHRGLWAVEYYKILTPLTAAQHQNTYQLVEGRVLNATAVRNTIYLNFGADWRTDFTITIKTGVSRLFRDASVNPLSLKEKTVRIRGWVNNHNGPLINATHPEQIEIFD